MTDRVYLDVKIAGVPRGRITVGLFGQEAPESVATFKTVAEGNLRGRGGRSAGYRYSAGSKVVRGRFVELGRVVQIDALNQSPGTPQRQPRLVEPPENRESNSIKHFPGAVSVRRGGGKFEFDIALAPDTALDESNIVIGRVVGGEDVVQMLANVPTTQKTSRDGFRNVGKMIGDARAKVDVRAVVPFCFILRYRGLTTDKIYVHFRCASDARFSSNTRWVLYSDVRMNRLCGMEGLTVI